MMVSVNCHVHMQVILLYHIIPDDLEWARDQMSLPAPQLSSLIAYAELADIVYSVSYNVYDYFKAVLTVTETVTGI